MHIGVLIHLPILIGEFQQFFKLLYSVLRHIAASLHFLIILNPIQHQMVFDAVLGRPPLEPSM